MDEAAAEVALGSKRSSTSEDNPRGVPARAESPPGTAAETEGVGTDAATEQTLKQTLAAKSEGLSLKSRDIERAQTPQLPKQQALVRSLHGR
jgi:hypothetical protein